MTTRSEAIDAFLAASGWAGAKRSPLAGDASFRRYERVKGEGRQAVLMDAPPQQEDVRPFMQVGTELMKNGLSAPRILASDIPQGFLLLEDLGDDLYSTLLKNSPECEEELYRAAADVLAELYRIAPQADYQHFPVYDEALLMRECRLFCEWFLPVIMEKEKAAKLGEEFCGIWAKLLNMMPTHNKMLVLRDYHADNLLWLPERPAEKRVGLLDFQDAVIGAPAYDMVSILEDARRDVSAKTVARVLEYYLRKTKQDKEAFMTSYALLGAQRNCKIIGIFVRLAMRDGKANYLSFLPRVWGHLMQDVQHPSLKELRLWLDAYIAPPYRGVIAVPPAQKKASA